jgi:hypothetical protein
MSLHRADAGRRASTRKARSEEPLPIWMSIIVIVGCAALSWALMISIAEAVLRFAEWP